VRTQLKEIFGLVLVFGRAFVYNYVSTKLTIL